MLNRTIAVSLFLIVCIVLAFLLVAKVISPITSGMAFALALGIFGGLSRGFRGKEQRDDEQ